MLDRGFYDRKKNSRVRFLLFLIVMSLLYYAANIYSKTFYHITLWEVIQNFKW